MRIAVTSENGKTITRHAGRARRFLVFETDPAGEPVEVARFALAEGLSLAAHADPSPLDGVDVLVSGSAGAGLVRRMARRGVAVAVTTERDPASALRALLQGTLQPIDPETGEEGHHHHHHHHHQRDGRRRAHGCGCGCGHESVSAQ